jgi:uncharacterized integral membrane protein
MLPATGRALAGPTDNPPAPAPELPMLDTGFAVPVPVAAAPPRSLRAALPRFAVAGVLSLAADAAAVLLTTTAADRGRASILLLLVGAPFAVCTAGACSAAVRARRGRRGAVVAARLAAGLMLLLQVILLMRVVAAAATPLLPDGPHLALPLGITLVTAITTGIVLTLAGRAGLGHPAVRLHVRPPAPVPATQPQFSWSAWTPPVPPPAQTPVEAPPPARATDPAGNLPPTEAAAAKPAQTTPSQGWTAP